MAALAAILVLPDDALALCDKDVLRLQRTCEALAVEAFRGIQDEANVNMANDGRRCVSDAASPTGDSYVALLQLDSPPHLDAQRVNGRNSHLEARSVQRCRPGIVEELARFAGKSDHFAVCARRALINAHESSGIRSPSSISGAC